MSDEQPDDGSEAWARSTDPEPSHVAASTVDAAHVEQQVLRSLEAHGPQTTEQLVDDLALPLVTISPRMKPLEGKGLVRRIGKRRNRSGVMATLWERTP